MAALQHFLRRSPSLATAIELLPVVMIGIVLRMFWLHSAAGTVLFVEAGEATRVAISVARGAGFADAFPGMGPTAHLSPVSPVIAGGILGVFVRQSPLGWAALGVWSMAQVILSYSLLWRLFGRIGFSLQTRRYSFILLCLLPVFVTQESVDFRYWEGALSVSLAAANLLLLASVRSGGAASNRFLIGAGALAALAFFVGPVSGLATVCCWSVFAPRHLGFVKTAKLAGAALVSVSVLVAPWAIRNAYVVGAPVLLRDNFGLELAMANYPGAIDAPDLQKAFALRLARIHPYGSPLARRNLQLAGGEVEYSERLGSSARHWIMRHPGDFALLCLRHIRQFLAPNAWQFLAFEAKTSRAVLLTIIDGFGLMGIMLALYQRRSDLLPVALYIALTALAYSMVQPIPRYTYLVYGMLGFMAVDFVIRCCGFPSWLRRHCAPRVQDRDRQGDCPTHRENPALPHSSMALPRRRA